MHLFSAILYAYSFHSDCKIDDIVFTVIGDNHIISPLFLMRSIDYTAHRNTVQTGKHCCKAF